MQEPSEVFWFPFSVSSGLLPLSETSRSLRAHILIENKLLKQSLGLSSLCQCDKLYFSKTVSIISFSPTVLQWILATPSSRDCPFFHYFEYGWALWLLWARGCGESNADVVWLLFSFCLGYLECLLLGNSFLEPSYHSARKSKPSGEAVVNSATEIPVNSQHHRPTMWVSHLRQPALLRLEILHPSQCTTAISWPASSENHSTEPTQPMRTRKEQ